MYLRLCNGKAKIDPEREARFYEFAWGYLPSHGFAQYEVSNYSLAGHACRHNLNTWSMNEWLGYGPSACSQFQGVRRKNLPDIEKWSAGMLGSKDPQFVEVEHLESTDLARDALLFGLRMNQGVNLHEIGRKFSIPFTSFSGISKFLDRLVDEGLALSDGHFSYRLTQSGRMLADAVAKEIPPLQSQ